MAFEWYPISKTGLDSIDYSTARLNIWEGAVRSSKTICSIIRWLEFIATAPPGNLLMIGKTERSLRRNILDPIRDIVGKKAYKANYGNGEVYIFGRHIYICGANDERSEGKIRGLSLVGAYGDELTLWPESFFRMLLSRLSVRGAKFFGTTNPDSPHHWLHEKFIQRQSKLNLAVFHFTLEDNLSLDPDYVESLKSEYTGLWYKRFIDGIWCVAEGAIYDMFDEDILTVTKLPKMTRHVVFCDYGTSAPAVFLLIGLGVDKRWYVIDEWRWDSREQHDQMTDLEYDDAMKAWLADWNVEPEFVAVDPSAKSFITQLRKSKWIKRVVKARNEVDDGIRRTATMFKKALILIHKRCKGLIREIMGYVWDTKKTDQGTDQPLKKADHGPDALRYFVNWLYAGQKRVVATT